MSIFHQRYDFHFTGIVNSHNKNAVHIYSLRCDVVTPAHVISFS